MLLEFFTGVAACLVILLALAFTDEIINIVALLVIGFLGYKLFTFVGSLILGFL